MAIIQKILFPVDFSPACVAAAPFTNRLEGTFGAARTASKANLSAEPRQLVAESNPSATRDYFEEILLNLFRRFLAGKP